MFTILYCEPSLSFPVLSIVNQLLSGQNHLRVSADRGRESFRVFLKFHPSFLMTLSLLLPTLRQLDCNQYTIGVQVEPSSYDS